MAPFGGQDDRFRGPGDARPNPADWSDEDRARYEELQRREQAALRRQREARDKLKKLKKERKDREDKDRRDRGGGAPGSGASGFGNLMV